MAAALEVVLKLRDNMTGGFTKAQGTVDRFAKNTKTAFRGMFNIPNLIAGTAAAAITKTLYDATTALEAMQSRMKSAVVTTENYNESMKFTRNLSRQLGLDIKATTNGFAGFAASALRGNLTMEQTKKIFEDVSVAATSLKLSKERLGLVFGALEQIAGKGKVSMEELRQQLGDSLPGAVGIAAKSMNMTTAAFMDAVKAGKIMSDEFLPRFGAQLRKELGGSSEEAANSLQANMTRVSNAIFRINSSLGSIMSGDASEGLGGLEQVLTRMADSIDKNAGKIRAGVLTVVLPVQILATGFKIAGDTVAQLIMIMINQGVWAFKIFNNAIEATANTITQLVRVMVQPTKLLEKDFRDSVLNAFADVSRNFDNIINDSKTFADEFTAILSKGDQEANKNIENIAQSMLKVSQAYDQAGKSIEDMKKKSGSGTGPASDPFAASIGGAGATENFSGISLTTGLNIQAGIDAQNQAILDSKLRLYESMAILEQGFIDNSIKRNDKIREAGLSIAQSLQGAFAEAFTIMIDLNTSAAEKIRGVMGSMFRYITQMLIQYLAKMAALKLATFLMTGGAGGGMTGIGTHLFKAFGGGGYATGTNNASPGWHWVGEKGPELMRFRGGEQVRSNYQSMGGQSTPISINTTIQGNADGNTVRAINDSNEKLARQIEDLVRKRYLPSGAFGL